MGILDNIIGALNLDGAEKDDYYDTDDEVYAEEGNVAFKSKPIGKDDPEIEISREKQTSKSKPVAAFPSKKRVASVEGMEMEVIKPTSFEQANEITTILLANKAVILNVENLDMAIAQRIIDFASGTCYAIGGHLQRLSKYMFVITPASVSVNGDFENYS